MEKVSLFLLAGRRNKTADPCLSSDLYVSDSINKAPQKIPGLSLACTITCRMASQAVEQSLLLANNQAKSYAVSLSDTCIVLLY